MKFMINDNIRYDKVKQAASLISSKWMLKAMNQSCRQSSVRKSNSNPHHLSRTW